MHNVMDHTSVDSICLADVFKKSRKAKAFYCKEDQKSITAAHRCRFTVGGKEVANYK